MIGSEAKMIAATWVQTGERDDLDAERAVIDDLSRLLEEAVPGPDAWMIHKEGPSAEALVLAGPVLYRVGRKGEGFAVHRTLVTENGFEIQLEQRYLRSEGVSFRRRRWILGDGLDNIVIDTEQRTDSNLGAPNEGFAVAVARATGWEAFEEPDS